MLKKQDVVLYEAILEKALATKDALEPYIREAEASETSLMQVLTSRGLFAEKELLIALAEKLKLSCLNLKAAKIEKDAIAKVPIKIAMYYRFLPISIRDRVLTVAVAAPLDIKTQDEIRTQLGYDIETVLACQGEVTDALKVHYGAAADALDRIIAQTPRTATAPSEEAAGRVDDIERLAGDASVIKLVNQIIIDAHRKRATDIHIEPYRQQLGIRYRVDGILYDANVSPDIKNFLSAIISRIKIMSNLNIVERRLPQDGRAIVRVQDQVLDLRISTIPTPYGESVVIRILPTTMLFSLQKLGLSKQDFGVFERLVTKPHGIIFVTGPTGSGKTTTLYACLSRINTKDRKIITIEDPIEYEMAGITQIQVQPEIGLDFARGLRSVLRHDPDVIMVGEVRDRETAEIAIRVALTGHLVFSTLHTNDAASGITRLVDIGVEPYLVASSVEAFIAQRLIRTICPDCRAEDATAPAELKKEIADELSCNVKDVKIYKGKGCTNCNSTGFFGRTAIYEMLILTDDIKDMIMRKTTPAHITKAAISHGMRTLRQDGWTKVIAGVTTPEEVLNVAPAEEISAGSGSLGTRVPDDGGFPKISNDDRRAYPRLDRKVNLRYRVFSTKEELLKGGFKPEQFSITKNISAAGLLFISDEPLYVGLFIELKIELPDGGVLIECLARIVRVEEVVREKLYDVAVSFLDITSAQKSRLNKYVDTESKG